MYDRALDEIRRKFVVLMRSDPPPHAIPREPLAPHFDRWVAKRFSTDEVMLLFRMECEYGERAVGDWFAEVVREAGVGPRASA